MTEYKHYLFEDFDTGEQFIVGEPTKEQAVKSANEYFADPHYICQLTEEEAENSGLDEY